MRYAALIQPKPEQLPILIGLGETWGDAMAGARAWFGAEMDRTNSKDWPRLIALQEGLLIYTEDEFRAKIGMPLDDWLAGMTAAGAAPKVATVAQEVTGAPLPTIKNSGSSSLPMVVYCTLGALLFFGIMAGVRYGGTQLIKRELDSITQSNSGLDIGSGTEYDSGIKTVDPDNLWGGMYEPIDMDPGISGIAGP